MSVFCGCQGCGNPLITDLVTIRYRQLGNFNKWELKGINGVIFAQGEISDGVFMRYRIVSIANNDSKPGVFHFDPNKIYAADPSERPQNPVVGLGGALGFDVAPGAVSAAPPTLHVTIKAKGDPASLGGQVEFLHYASSAGEHVLMVNENPEATSVPYLNPLTNQEDVK
jgi:hypothetical protein